MSLHDLKCSVCGEPVEYHYMSTEYTPLERVKFMAGLGCDSCDWGACTTCKGSGKSVSVLQGMIMELNGQTADPCPVCKGTGKREPLPDAAKTTFENLDTAYTESQ
jgi:DnaJ-class molecular chaperone